jgi:hypothetical protein
MGVNGMPSFLRGLAGRLAVVAWDVLLVTLRFVSICTVRGVSVSDLLLSKD